MSGFDIAVILIVVFFGVVGWIRGFSWQLMGVLTLVLGFTCAYPISSWLEPTMTDWLGFSVSKKEAAALTAADQRDIHFLARGASWAMAFALIWLFTHVVYYFFREAIEHWHMEELNRTLGGIFGVIKGALVVCAMTLVLVILGVERTRTAPDSVRVVVPSLIRGSMFAPSITSTLRVARFALPESFAQGMSHYLDALAKLDPDTHAASVKEEDVESGTKDGGSTPDAGDGDTKAPEGETTPDGAETPPAEGDTPPDDDTGEDDEAPDDG